MRLSPFLWPCVYPTGGFGCRGSAVKRLTSKRSRFYLILTSRNFNLILTSRPKKQIPRADPDSNAFQVRLHHHNHRLRNVLYIALLHNAPDTECKYSFWECEYTQFNNDITQFNNWPRGCRRPARLYTLSVSETWQNKQWKTHSFLFPMYLCNCLIINRLLHRSSFSYIQRR